MALQKCGLNRNRKNKELQPHGSLEFPCAGYESAHTNSIDDFIPWHWHEEFEIIHIVEGSMKLQVLSETFLVQAGETAIINANALHCASGEPYCKLQSLVFSPLLITGNVNSAFASRYIMPLISCTQFSGIVLKNHNATVSSHFSIAFESLKNDAFAYETEDVVSSDIIGYPAGSIFDSQLTKVVENGDTQLVKTVAWYDNEAGYVSNLVRTLDYLAKL